jgi:hypothetical protein
LRKKHEGHPQITINEAGNETGYDAGNGDNKNPS